MEWVLSLGHAALGTLVLAASFTGPAMRRRAVELASVAGVILGVALVVAGQAGTDPWRTQTFEPAAATPAGLLAAAAWLVTGALAGRTRASRAALTGVASAGLVLATGGHYVVPALVFWLCASVALATATRSKPLWALLAASDAAVCAAAVLHVSTEDTWTFDGLGGAALVALAVGAVVRAGAFLVSQAPVAAFVAGGGVALAASRVETAEPWAALLLLLVAAAASAAAHLRRSVGPRQVATWTGALALSVCFTAPGHAPLAGAAAVLAFAAGALWPYTSGRGGVARALLVSAVPLTAGFGMVAAGAAAAFERATVGAGGDALWSIVAVLLPAALAAGVLAGARAARADGSEFVPEAVLATWVLLGAALAVGVVPQAFGEAGPLGDSGGTVAAQLLALGAGAAAGIYTRRADLALEPVETEIVPADAGVAPALSSAAAWATLAVAAAVVVGALWLTVAGLRVGFL